MFRLLKVLSAVGFYYQFCFQADEIDYVGFDDDLAAEFVVCHSMGA